MLRISVEPSSMGLFVELIKDNNVGNFASLDSYFGDAASAMKIVADWIDLTENLTTTKNL